MTVGGRPRLQPTIDTGERLVVWVLSAAAALHLLIPLWAAGVIAEYPDLSPGGIARAATSASTFLLAAGVVAGAVRWSAGRRWLFAGAAALIVHGVLQLALDAWIARMGLGGGAVLSEPELALVAIRGWLAILASLAAYLALASGLLLSRPQAAIDPRQRRRVAGALAILGVLAIVVVLAQPVFVAMVGVARSPAYPPTAADWALYLLFALLAGAPALVGIAAVWSMPRRYRLPELTVALGAACLVIGTAGRDVLQALMTAGGTWWLAAGSFLGEGLVLLGTLGMALGFALGRVSAAGD